MMKSFWDNYSKLAEKATGYAEGFLKNNANNNNQESNQGNMQQALESFKQDTLNALDDKVKENEAYKKENAKSKERIKEVEEENKKLNEKNNTLLKTIEELKKIKEEDDREKEELKNKLGSFEIDGFKEILNKRFDNIKVDISNFNIDYSDVINRLKEINEEMNKVKVEENKTITIEEKPKEEEKHKETKEEEKPKEEVKEEPLKTLSDAIEVKEEEKKEEEKASPSNNSNNNSKKKRKKNKRNKNKSPSPLEETPKEEESQSDKPKEEKPKEEEPKKEDITNKADETKPEENPKPNDQLPPTAMQTIDSMITNNDNSIQKESTNNNTQAIIDDISLMIISKLSPLLDSYKSDFQSYISSQIEIVNRNIEKIYQSNTNSSIENESLKGKVNSLSNELKTLQSQLTSFDSIKSENNTQKEKITSMEGQLKSLDTYNKELNEKIKEITTVKENIDKNYKTIIQTFKQFFLLLLSDDIFIDSIEKVFKTSNDDKFFELVYGLAKYIKPKIIFDYKKSFILTNTDSLTKVDKYNLISFKEIKSKYSDIKSLDLLLKENDSTENDFIYTLTNELTSYVDSLNSSVLSMTKKNDELLETMRVQDENKKKEIEKMLSFQNEIKEKNAKINSLEKIALENKNLKLEIEKLNTKINEQLKEANDQIKEKNTFNDKISLISQQCEVFKVENQELLNKITESKSEIEKSKNIIESLTKENNKLKESTSQIEKINQKIKEQDNIITIKDNEYKKLQNSYMELETFLENSKKEKDLAIESYQKQINELTSQNESLSNKVTSLNETLQSTSNEANSLQSSSKKVESLEAQVTSLEIENKNLKEQKNKLKKYSEEIVKKIQNDYQQSEYLIDKRMISSILFKYFDPYTNSSIKYSLLETLANFMNYSNDERKQLGLSTRSSNDIEIGKASNDDKDKLKKLGEELYDFILNS